MSSLLDAEKEVFKKSRVFKEGDEVAVCHSGLYRQAPWQMKVAKVTKRYIELNDGSKWSLDTWEPWGPKRLPRYTRNDRIEPWTAEHEEECLRRALETELSIAKREDLSSLPIEDVQTLLRILRGVKKKEQGK